MGGKYNGIILYQPKFGSSIFADSNILLLAATLFG